LLLFLYNRAGVATLLFLTPPPASTSGSSRRWGVWKGQKLKIKPKPVKILFLVYLQMPSLAFLLILQKKKKQNSKKMSSVAHKNEKSVFVFA
jgi:hypothetical protein